VLYSTGCCVATTNGSASWCILLLTGMQTFQQEMLEHEARAQC
jgi:hypothetical protein